MFKLAKEYFVYSCR